jgi:uncharacterized protein involved in exopolysaccharide biosynthesis
MIKIRTAIQSTEAKLKTEIDKVVDSVKSEYESARAQEVSLAARSTGQKYEALSLNRKGIEYSVYRREAEVTGRLRVAAASGTKETGISGEFKASTIRVGGRRRGCRSRRFCRAANVTSRWPV